MWALRKLTDINQIVCIMDNNTINAAIPITLKQDRLTWTNIPNIVQRNYILENAIIFLSICSFHAHAVVHYWLAFLIFICIEVEAIDIIMIPTTKMPFRAICKFSYDIVVDVGVQDLNGRHDHKWSNMYSLS